MRLASISDNTAYLAKTAAGQANPVLDAEFEDLMARLGPFERHPVIAVAVSGGPDSLALTLLAARWAKKRGGLAVGLTVDHDLRPGSADEAEQTGRWLKAHGIIHRTLAWTDPKPKTGIQQRARAARYKYLQGWCRNAGILHLLTAHHRQDQAETVALRRARQSGPRGLASMAVIRELSGLRLLRPLLDIDKARLLATLNDSGQDWLDDPSNRYLGYARNRLRHDGIDTERLAADASLHGKKRRLSDRRLNSTLMHTVTIDPAGFARAPTALFDALPADLAQDLLERVLMTIGGNTYPPRKMGLRRLLSAMQNQQPFDGRTLANCRILNRKGQWLFCREAGTPSTLALIPWQWQRWQARFLIRFRGDQAGLTLRQLGDQDRPTNNRLLIKEKKCSLPLAVRSSLPSIWCDHELLAIPHIGYFGRSFDASLLDLRFRPCQPLANAPFAAHMCSRSSEETVALIHC